MYKKCSICNRNAVRLVQDHDHDTGFLRGKICDHCNLGLGHYKDSIGSLFRSIGYLMWYRIKWILLEF